MSGSIAADPGESEPDNGLAGICSRRVEIGGEAVSEAVEGVDDAEAGEVGAEFAAEAGDGGVDGAVGDVGVAGIHVVEEAFAGEDVCGVAHEGVEEGEFVAGEGEGDGVDFEAEAVGVEAEGAAGEGEGLGAGAAEDGEGAGDEFAVVEGFGDVVVGAGLQAADAVVLLAEGGEHDEGLGGVEGADAGEEFEAGDAGEAEIEENEIGGMPAVEGEAAGAVGGAVDGPAFFLEEEGDDIGDVGFVLDEQEGDGAGGDGGGRGEGLRREGRL